MPHTDGPLYYPFVNAISLGSPCIFKFFKDFQSYQEKIEAASILCEPLCLTCFTEEAYNDYLHCIEDNAIDYIYLFLIDEENSPKHIKISECNVCNF